jgi:hypothetical protein
MMGINDDNDLNFKCCMKDVMMIVESCPATAIGRFLCLTYTITIKNKNKINLLVLTLENHVQD